MTMPLGHKSLEMLTSKEPCGEKKEIKIHIWNDRIIYVLWIKCIENTDTVCTFTQWVHTLISSG